MHQHVLCLPRRGSPWHLWTTRLTLMGVASLLMFTGCSPRRPPSPPVTAAHPTPEPPPSLPSLSSATLTTPDDPELAAALTTYRNTGTLPVIKKPSIVRHPYRDAEEVTVTCSTLRVTTIRLQEGEEVNSVVLGDKVRWHVQAGFLGEQGVLTPLLLVKPTEVGLKTDLTIATTRRLYHFLLVASANGRTREVAFWYPDDELAKVNGTFRAAHQPDTATTQFPAVNLDALNLNYDITGDAVPWAPLQAFDDGKHTYLRMRADLGDTPTLMVQREQGPSTIVNYRVIPATTGSYYVVDAVPRRLVLVAGTGQQVVITKRER